MTKRNLLDDDRESLRSFFISLGEKPYHADQVIQWIHQYGITNFDQMSNLSKKLRDHLKENAVISPPTIIKEQQSSDDTRKWLLALEDQQCIEMVFIPEDDRGTLCISSQVGCPLKCQFCATGQMGFVRNLKVYEIIGQVFLAVRLLSKKNGQHDRQVTNIVFMGMGEPLLNYDNVLKATHILMDDLAYSFSKYRVTISTVGIVPKIEKLSKESEVSLAVSLHAPTDELRNQIIPTNQQYPLAQLMKVCRNFFSKGSKRKISIEYILIAGFNDQRSHANALIKLLEGVPSKINLIPYNPVDGLDYKRPTAEAIDAFRDQLIKAGLVTVTRKKRGGDISAACGQLAAKK